MNQENKKTEHVIMGIAAVEEDVAALRESAIQERRERHGGAKAFEVLSTRLIAEVANVGQLTKKLLDDPKADERTKVIMEGKVKGLELAVLVVKELADQNLVALRQADGAVEAFSRLLQRTEQRKTGERRKAEQRANEATRDPEGTRPDGSPAPIQRAGKKSSGRKGKGAGCR